jgi:hypothetical protein
MKEFTETGFLASEEMQSVKRDINSFNENLRRELSEFGRTQ